MPARFYRLARTIIQSHTSLHSQAADHRRDVAAELAGPQIDPGNFHGSRKPRMLVAIALANKMARSGP